MCKIVGIKMPEIPRAFIQHSQVRHVLCHTIDEFDCEEQAAIYYYCFMDLPVSEIAALTKLSQNHVASALALYSERLEAKLRLFKKAIPFSADDLLPVTEILSIEFWEKTV